MDSGQIEAVRRFNRALTRRIGVLDDSYLGLGRPLAEARLLYEIGTRGAEARELRARLPLDSGCLSRLLRSRERQGAARADVERLMQAGAVEVTVVSPRSPAAESCVAEYFRELRQRFAGGFPPAK